MSEIDFYGLSKDRKFVRSLQTDGDKVISGSHQDVEPIIEQNNRIREMQQANGHRGEIFRKIASVPVAIYEQAVHEGWDEDDWTKWLNRSENKVFRVWEGSV